MFSSVNCIFRLYYCIFRLYYCTPTKNFPSDSIVSVLIPMDIHAVHNYPPTNTFLLKINTKPVKSSEKFFLTMTYYYIQTKLSTYFTNNFFIGHKTDINVYLQKIAKAKLPQNINNALRKFGFVYFSDILLLEQGG